MKLWHFSTQGTSAGFRRCLAALCCFSTIICYCHPTLAADAPNPRALIHQGDSTAEITDKLGPALAVIQNGNSIYLTYPEGRIVIQNDHATLIPLALLSTAPIRTQPPLSGAPAMVGAANSPKPVPVSAAAIPVVSVAPAAPATPAPVVAASSANTTKPATPAGNSTASTKPAAPRAKPPAPPPEDTGQTLFGYPVWIFEAAGLLIVVLGAVLFLKGKKSKKSKPEKDEKSAAPGAPATPAKPGAPPAAAGVTAAAAPKPAAHATSKPIPLRTKAAEPPPPPAAPPPKPSSSTSAGSMGAEPPMTAPPMPIPPPAPPPPPPPTPKLVMPSRVVTPAPIPAAEPAKPAEPPKPAETPSPTPRLGLKLPSKPPTPPPGA